MRDEQHQVDSPVTERPTPRETDVPRFAHVDPEVEREGNHDTILREQVRNFAV